MASSQTLKQRFIDLLFEDEYDVSNTEVQNKSTDTRIKASDILYKKPEVKKEETKITVEKKPQVEVEKPVEKKIASNSAFINYQETTKKKEEVKEVKQQESAKTLDDEKYVAQPFLSPIFGNIEKEDKKIKESVSNVNYACLEKPRSNYLGTVLSPIYGYDSIIKNKKEKVKKEEIVASDVTDNLTDIFSTVELKNTAFDNVEKTSEVSLFEDLYKSKD